MAALLFFRQARQRCQLLQIRAQRLRRSAPERDALPTQNFVGQDTALSTQQDALSNARVLSNADLAAEHDAPLDHDASRQTGLRSNHDVFADLAVVADVN